MMKKTFQTIYFLLTFAGMAMVGCTDDLGITPVYRPSDVISFTATLGSPTVSGTSRSSSGHLAIEEEEWRLDGVNVEGAGSRASVMSTLHGEEAGVLGYKESTTGTTTSFLNNGTFKFDGDELTAVGSPTYWKDVTSAPKVHLYAYAPKEITLSEDGATGIATLDGTTLKITVPDAVADQQDIIADSAQVLPAKYNKTVPLAFDHILTGIRFKIGFDCTVKSVTVTNVCNYGEYKIGEGWISDKTTGSNSYTISFGTDGKSFSKDAILTNATNANENADIMMLIPQAFSATSTSEVILTKGDGSQIKASLANMTWQPGKLITYTLYEGSAPSYIYLDLAAGNVFIGCTETIDSKGIITATETDTYTGYVFENGEKILKQGTHAESNIYYVYQTNENNTGTSALPNYSSITYNDKPWADFIKNNTSVAGVINAWKEAAKKVGRTATGNRIRVYGSNKVVNLTIDNIYSTYAERSVARTTAGIGFNAETNSKLTITTVGDNRVSAIHYYGGYNKNNELILEGTGSLTVGAASGLTEFYNMSYVGETAENDTTFIDNHWCSAIGGNDSGEGNSCGIIINSGNIFAGTTKAENCTAIGAGGNDRGIITINGGTVTAVATTTGTAIGGGIGFNSSGGVGVVTINNGNVYAYNHANRWSIPSSAIGGAGSYKSTGTIGTVTIGGGYVYAYSALGTAIGGGSSRTKNGGKGKVTINGGMVIAKTGNKNSACIGGGTGNSDGKIYGEGNDLRNDNVSRNGGDAEVTINGGIIRTGSIGGGGTGSSEDKIGNATVTITGGDIQAQCILAAGSGGTPKFEMTGGVLRNTNVIPTPDAEYLYVKEEGGAVYLEDGTCTISGADTKISNCTATKGGAIYIKGQAKADGTYTASFTMSGGTIEKCTSDTEGGAVYLYGGDVKLTGGTIANNLAQGGNGGGICITKGNFTMSKDENNSGGNASIRNNSALYRNDEGGNGGGVYITSSDSDVDVDILSGSITGNSSDRKGGGVCVVMPENVDANGNPLYEANVIVGTDKTINSNPDISGNSTILEGGGLYVEGAGDISTGFNTNILINGGKINGNQTSAYVDNENIVNYGGIVTLEGGDVPSVTVTYHGNGGVLSADNTKDSDTRLIVKAANNILIAPAFTHKDNVALKVTKWNNRPDGLGDKTYTPGGVIYVTSDRIDLYAQWGQ